MNLRRPWTREETLLAMNLYCRIPFGRQHARAPEVVELASALGRTPSSVAMKLNNLTSLDPAEAARGVKGLVGASALDRAVWDAFHHDWEALAIESEDLWVARVGSRAEEGASEEAPGGSELAAGGFPSEEPIGLVRGSAGRHRRGAHRGGGAGEAPDEPALDAPTARERIATERLCQAFFRRSVLAAYQARCCVSGVAVPELLEAAHIVGFASAPEQRANPRNGLCLSRLHHAAFDRGLIAIDAGHRLIVSRRLKAGADSEMLRVGFLEKEGRPIALPAKLRPDADLLARHRAEVFEE